MQWNTQIAEMSAIYVTRYDSKSYVDFPFPRLPY